MNNKTETAMKKYITPEVDMTAIMMQSLLSGGSVKSVTGLDDVTKADEEFPGGTGDSRKNYNVWDDEEEEEEKY